MKTREQHTEVMRAVSVDPLLLEEEFARIPADLAYWNEKYANAYRVFLRAKATYDQVEAARALVIREEQSMLKKITEGTIRAYVETDDEVVRARLQVIDAEVEKVRLWGVLDALRAKKEALISIGAHMRAEMSGNPSLREAARGARDVESTRRKSFDETDED